MHEPPRLRGGPIARLAWLLAGLVLFAAGIVALLESRLGLTPWDVLHQGIARHTPLTFGEANIAVSMLALLVAWRLGARIGLGTLLNAALVGSLVQVLSAIPAISQLATLPPASRMILLVAGPPLIALGTGLYIGADLGAGPRDSLMVAGAARLRSRVGLVRVSIELSVLGLGVALGGTVGPGTAAFALGIGPLVELSFWLMERSPLTRRQPLDRGWRRAPRQWPSDMPRDREQEAALLPGHGGSGHQMLEAVRLQCQRSQHRRGPATNQWEGSDA